MSHSLEALPALLFSHAIGLTGDAVQRLGACAATFDGEPPRHQTAAAMTTITEKMRARGWVVRVQTIRRSMVIGKLMGSGLRRPGSNHRATDGASGIGRKSGSRRLECRRRRASFLPVGRG